MNIWMRSNSSRENVKFWERSFRKQYDPLTYQQATREFFFNFVTLPLIFILCFDKFYLTVLYYPEQHKRSAFYVIITWLCQQICFFFHVKKQKWKNETIELTFYCWLCFFFKKIIGGQIPLLKQVFCTTWRNIANIIPQKL